MGWSDDAARNRESWTRANSEYTGPKALEKWRQGEITWGLWSVPEAELGALPHPSGLDVVELGCGTAYFSAWLAARGARPVGVDVTPAQLETARACMRETGIEFPLVEADGGETGLPDACADLVVSEYGASIWVDPYRFVPEAARLLRPEGRLVFMCGTPLLMICGGEDEPSGERLLQPLFGMHRFDWGTGVEFALPHGAWIRLLRAHGFEVEQLIEVQAPAGAEKHARYDYVTPEWARKWPAEEIWVARKQR
jgi:SAM-dependent methyltransferase